MMRARFFIGCRALPDIIRDRQAWTRWLYEARQCRGLGVIDMEALAEVTGFQTIDELRASHRAWIEDAPQTDSLQRQNRWTESIAVASRDFVAKVSADLALRARSRHIERIEGAYVLREAAPTFARVSWLEKAR